MTRERRNLHKENMDKITERLGGRRDDIWQDRFIYDIAAALSDILIEMERSDHNGNQKRGQSPGNGTE